MDQAAKDEGIRSTDSLILKYLPLIVSSIATCSLFGWLTHNDFLVRFLPNSAPMQFNTALCFLMLSCACFLKNQKRFSKGSFWFALVTLVFSFITLIQYPLQINLHIDSLFVTPFTTVKTSHPGRMAPNTALAFVFSSISLLVCLRLQSTRSVAFSGILALCSLAISFLSLVGYGINLELLYGWGLLTRMAILTATSHFLLACLILTFVHKKALRNQFLSRVWDTAILCSLGSLVSFSIWIAAVDSETKSLEAKFKRDSELQVTKIQSKIDSDLAYLSQIANFFSNSEKVTEGEFYSFVTEISEEKSFLEVIDWVPFLQTFERKEPMFRFKFSHDLIDNPSNIAGKYDYSANPLVAKAMVDAASSIKVVSVDVSESETFKKPVEALQLLVIVPVAKKNSPDQLTPSSKLQGLIIGAFKIPNSINNAIDPLILNQISLSIINKARGARNSIGNSKFVLPATFQNIEVVSVLSIAGSELEALLIPSSIYIEQEMTFFPFSLLLAALSITFITSAYLYHLRKQQDDLKHRKILLRERTKEAEAANVLKSQFVANITHEMRTPLTSIIGYSEALLSSDMPASQQSLALESVHRNAQHLHDLISGVLDLSKIEAGKMEFEKVQIPLPFLVDDLTTMMKERAQTKGLSFDIHYEFPLPQSLETDPKRLKQVLINLVGNAIKFTEVGFVSLSVTFDQKSQLLHFAIQDTGIGLTESEIEKLFQPFTQLDGSASRAHSGTGLGLVISQQLVRGLGGYISVASAPGKGSTFTVSIPTGEVLPNDILFSLPSKNVAQVPKSNFSTPSFVGNVLVVEDGVDNQRFIQFLLKRAGVTVTLANDGYEALKVATQKSFDLILMDLQMPNLDGFDATRKLRSQGYSGPILACSANAITEEFTRCVEAGCNDFISKPFVRNEFYNKLARYLAPQENQLSNSIDTSTEEAELKLEMERFVSGFPVHIQELSRLHAEGLFEHLKFTAHRLAGASAFAYPEISQTLKHLEQASAQRSAKLCGELIQDLKFLHDRD